MSTKLTHTVILLIFVLLSVFLAAGRIGTAFDSFALLTPNLGVYTSLAAAQDHPDLFTGDPFLSNEKNTNSYNMVFIPIVKKLSQVFGNYGTACAFLLPWIIFIHLTGYYLLGISIFKNPWAGLLVSLLLSTPTTTAYDFWGLTLDVLPRFIYQSLLPFVLVVCVRFGKDPKWWTVILGGVGLLNYVHPLSTPTWAVAVMLSLWVSVPQLSFREKLRNITVAGIVLLLILTPFISNYVRSTVIETSQVVDYDHTISILRSHISSMREENYPFLVIRFFTSRTGSGQDIIWWLLWGTGLGGLIYGFSRLTKNSENIQLRQITAWMLGILLVGGVIPTLEQMLFAYLRQIPPEFEILRTLRYLTPLILLVVLYILWLAIDTLKQKAGSTPITRYGFAISGVLFLILWGLSSEGYRVEFRNAIRQNISCFTKGSLLCDLPTQSMDFIGILDVIREETPVGSLIFSEGQEVAIRYYALRPLAFTYKDGAPLAYTDPQGLLIWSKTYEEMDQLSFIRKFPFRLKRFMIGIVDVARANHSDYLLIQEPYTSDLYIPDGISLVHSNGHYSLFKLNQ